MALNMFARARVARVFSPAFALVVVVFAAPAAAAQAGSPSAPDAQASVAVAEGTAKAALERDAVCRACHGESWVTPLLTVYQTRHGNKADARTPGCQDCHGKSEAHAKDPGTSPDVVFGAKSKHLSTADARSASCLGCHESKVLPRTNWTGSQHEARGVACNDCHNIHAPRAESAEQGDAGRSLLHVPQGAARADPPRLGAPAGGDEPGEHRRRWPVRTATTRTARPGPKLLVKNSVNETCYTCHPERRGPFLWEHAPVADNCTNCHTPHGSTNAPLLKTRAPWLCQECHSGDHAQSGQQRRQSGRRQRDDDQRAAAAGRGRRRARRSRARACLNCHVLIHGSNHPAGAKFQR